MPHSRSCRSNSIKYEHLKWPDDINESYMNRLKELRDRFHPDDFKRLYMAEFPTERGSGRTMRQIIAAPVDAIYVVSHGAMVDYTRRLARFLDRPDLVIMTADAILDCPEKLFSSRREVVEDHALYGALTMPSHRRMRFTAVMTQYDNYRKSRRRQR